MYIYTYIACRKSVLLLNSSINCCSTPPRTPPPFLSQVSADSGDSLLPLYVAVCCKVLQCVAVCCSVLQCAAVCYNVLQCVAVPIASLVKIRTVLQFVAVCGSVLQCVAVLYSVSLPIASLLQTRTPPALSRSVLQCAAVTYSVLQFLLQVSCSLSLPLSELQCVAVLIRSYSRNTSNCNSSSSRAQSMAGNQYLSEHPTQERD